MAGRTIAVLGMHRSGTSCLVGLLEQAGVFLGDVSRKNPSNAKGNRENARIMALHEELLKVNDGTWDAPPEAVSWPRDLKARRDEIIQSYRDSALWGFKDPRTLLTLEGWLEVLPGLELVGIFRHPLAVAESLRRRNGFSIEKGLGLWSTYNDRLLRYRERYGFPVVCFDADGLTELVGRLAASLGLPPATGLLDFFEAELIHAAPDGNALMPDHVHRLHLELKRAAFR
jgi:hypothetical protein